MQAEQAQREARRLEWASPLGDAPTPGQLQLGDPTPGLGHAVFCVVLHRRVHHHPALENGAPIALGAPQRAQIHVRQYSGLVPGVIKEVQKFKRLLSR